MNPADEQRSPFDIAADWLFYAPIGLALQASKVMPEWAKEGRQRLEIPLRAARVVGEMAVAQGRREVDQRLKKTTAPPTAAPGPQQSAPAPEQPAYPMQPAPEQPATVANLPKVEDLALAGYPTLSAGQIVVRLDNLDHQELVDIRAYEQATRGRKSILDRIESLLVSRP